MYGEEEEKITLDKQTFKTLASDTRVGILKSLTVRRKTLSELAKEYGMSVSTIKEHLDNLVTAGLIVQKDDGHKWKYYELTRKGRGVLNPEEKKIWILLSLSALAVIAAGFDMATGFFGKAASRLSPATVGTVPEAFNVIERGAEDLITGPSAPSVIEKAVSEVPMAAGAEAGAEAGIQAGAEAAVQSAAQATAMPWVHIAIIIIFAALAGYFLFRLIRSRKNV